MIWLDAHLPPNVAYWIRDTLGYPALHVRDMELRDAEDGEIFQQARLSNVIIITKDRDFADMVQKYGPPPKVIWLRCGNTSATALKEIFSAHLDNSLNFRKDGENLVEIR